MKHMKKLTALALTLLLALNLSVSALAKSIYPDTADTAALDLLSVAKVFDGYTDGAFHGEKVLTRAQFTKIACQMLGVKVDENAVPTFADAKDNWAAAYIAAAYDAGIISGKSTSVFAPDEPITHYQAAMIFARMVGFDDGPIASLPWGERVEKAVKTAKLDGFMTLNNAALTRAEAADAAYVTLLAKFLQPKELTSILTADTLAGKLGFTTESGKAADGTATIRFVRYTTSGTQKTAAYPVAAGSALPAPSAAPVAEKVTVQSGAVTYGYVVGNVGEALWDNGKTYHTVDLWNGEKIGELYTSADIPVQRPLLVSYERDSDNAISNLKFNYPGDGTLFAGAIEMLEDDEYFRLSDGSVRLFTEDTVVLYIDSTASRSEDVGQTDGTIAVADKDSGGAYINNVFYTLDKKGNLTCVIYDVNNAVPAVTP